ncbi:stage II sporulation protein M [Garciella nitratireducens]|uniref:Stage II sporulation protein M n=1 Tax=Garciella nitratireducens DSM 15102 TaxID=1121911 RepID=A0A1T4JUA4_9FIRM|nr:stage II sporulation protein M [Garciella nitratireducens]RBP45573.1 stage II sporulation protein M [Garciella nitratireducens]SJZ33695.1 stage II sporulation protein M [Garciella nitratireducens DSM 15102]
MKNLLNVIQKHIRLNIIIYIITILALTIGIVMGTYTVKALSDSQKVELINYLEGFFQILESQKFDSYQLFFQTFINQLKLLIPIWILGATVIGMPIIILILGFRGFILGFTIGFIIDEFAFNGILFIILSILPHNLFYLPGLIGIGVMSISFSLFLLKSKLKKEKVYNRKAQFWTYTIVILMISIFLLLGSIIEGYITPIFMKTLSPNFI